MYSRIEELRQAGLAHARAGELEEAIACYDSALAIADDETIRELITINKADALISLDRTGPEVQALPAILMQRRNDHHTFLAAYALTYRHRVAGELKRAIFYGQIALDAATEAHEALWELGALNELGSVYEMDSQFERAIGSFERALALIDAVSEGDAHSISYSATLQNLGSSMLLAGRTQEGIDAIERAMPKIMSGSARAEACIDLCFGYLELGKLDVARSAGEEGLHLATEPRQLRNAHYLLGEIAYELGDSDAAAFHFDELARFYPQFRNLKNVLFAIDLRSMLNLKL